jgi:hypothetical protein
MFLTQQNSVFNTCLALIALTVLIGSIPKPAESAEKTNSFAVTSLVSTNGKVEFSVLDTINDVDLYKEGYMYILNERAEVGKDSALVSLWVKWENGIYPEFEPLADRNTRTLAYCMNSGRELIGDNRGINLHRNLCDSKDEYALEYEEFLARLDRSYLKWGNPIEPEFKFEKIVEKRNLLDEQ